MENAELETGSEDLKSYFFVLSEGKGCSEIEGSLIDAFENFQKVHTDDSEVIFLTPEDDRFHVARELFKINQIPAFVLSDEPNKLEKKSNPFLSFNRPAIEKFPPTGIINLITDIHYILIDHNILRVRARIAKSLLYDIFRDVYREIKDFMNLVVHVQ